MRKLKKQELKNTKGGILFWVAVLVVLVVSAVAGYFVGKNKKKRKKIKYLNK